MTRSVFTAGLLLLASATTAPGQWRMQEIETDIQFRGLSAPDDSVVWAAGADGTYARTVDRGATWSADTVPGATSLFFVDVHAVDDSVAYLLGTDFDGGHSAIYKTTDAGTTWTLQHEDRRPGVFMDGLAFWDPEHGVAFGDPVDSVFVVLTTGDGGDTWTPVPAERLPAPLPGEAGFAAGGTAITVAGQDHVWIGTGGGARARVLMSSDRGRSWSAVETPLPGDESSGIFGLAFRDTLNGVAAGGDYRAPDDSSRNILRTRDGGRTWSLIARSQPPGVRYGAVYAHPGAQTLLVAVGPSGWGYSADDGVGWTLVDTMGLFTVTAAPDGTVWMAGDEGRIVLFQPRF